MRTILVSITTILVLLAASVAAADPNESIQQADRLWIERYDPARAMQALELLREARDQHPDSYGVQWRLARLCFWLCDGTSDTDRKRAIGKEGWDAGERAIALEPSGIEGYYWAALTMGEHAKGLSIPEAMAANLEPRFNGYLDKVLASDEGFGEGGALRARACYWAALPPLMRSYPRSLEYLQRSDQLVPGHPRTLYYMAEVHHAMGNEDEARQAIDASLGAPFEDRAERARMLVWGRSLEQQIR
jgi:hypothetical protein